VAALTIVAVAVPLGLALVAFLFRRLGSSLLVCGAAFGMVVRNPFLALQHNWAARRRDAEIRATSEGLYADGSLLVPRERIAEGHLESSGKNGSENGKNEKSLRVRLTNAKGHCLVDVDVLDRARGEELLAALGLLDPTVAATFAVEATRRARLLRFAMGLAVVLTAVGLLAFVQAADGGFAVVLATLVGVFLNELPWQTRRARIAPDGITISSLRRDDFIPFSRVHALGRVGQESVLSLEDGSEIRLASLAAGGAPSALEARIDAAFTAWKSTVATVDTADLAARKGRTVAEWASSLRELTREIVDYRKPAVPKEALWRLLEDPRANTTSRAGAAFALAEQNEDGARLQRVSTSVASPRLRVALERMATADGQAARRDALALVEAEEEESRGEASKRN
jgi:hypothetical protein